MKSANEGRFELHGLRPVGAVLTSTALAFVLTACGGSAYMTTGEIAYTHPDGPTPPSTSIRSRAVTTQGTPEINLTSGCFGGQGCDPNDAAWSPDGTRLAFRFRAFGQGGETHEAFQIVTVDSLGNNFQRITDTSNTPSRDPAWSPDGLKLAWNEGGSIAIVDLCNDQLPVRNPDILVQNAGQPTWSQDGAWIAYQATRNGNTDIYKVPVSGTSGPIRLTDDPAVDRQPAWTKPGHGTDRISFASDRSGNFDIWRMEPDGSNEQQVTSSPDDESNPEFSNLGVTIVYDLEVGSNQFEIHHHGIGGSSQQLISVGQDPSARQRAKNPKSCP